MNSPTLEKADSIIHGDRQDQYGNPEDSFSIIADFWNVYLYEKCKWTEGDLANLNAQDVAIMMTLFKIARMFGKEWSRDNAIDACGYLAILNDKLKPTDGG